MTIINNEIQEYYLAFSYFNKLGPQKIRLLENYFTDLKEAFWSKSFNLERAGLSSKLSTEFLNWRKSFSLNKAKNELIKNNINFITWNSKLYPQILKEIYAPPPVLFFKGQIPHINSKRLAVVGSRQHSIYANKVISKLLPIIIKNKIEIISGLARGVDTLAHKITLENKGITLAILGSGLDFKHIYPSDNLQLSEEIINSGGTLLSEFPPGTPPLKQNFPQRNRIISGLCQATLVIESKIKSGSLITARWALEQNREVAAIPGNIFSIFSAGPNKLISSGAKIIKSAEDILEIFKINNNFNPLNNKAKIIKNKSYKIENKTEDLIYKLFLESSKHHKNISFKKIKDKLKLDTTIITSKLIILENKKVIKKNEFGYYLS